MAGNEIATVEKEIEAIYNGIKKLATDGSALERFRRFDEMYQRTRLRERTTLVFCGKYSTGKSTIMRALTGDDSIAVGVGETTSRNQEFLWGDGLLLVDTPGIFTDTAENAREAKRAMDEADMIAYCVSSNLFDHTMDETGYFKQLLRDYRDKLILCITKCPNTSPKLYFNIEDDVITAIGDAAYSGDEGRNELAVFFFDAKDYIEGRKTDDKGLILTSNFEPFLMCINRFSETETYSARCILRIRQMQSCLDDILKSIPCPSQEEGELSKEEKAELNRIEDVRRRAFAEIKHLGRCEMEITQEVRTALHENGSAELLLQLEQSAKDKLEDAVNEVQKKIHSILAELEIAVHIDDPKIMELKIDGSGMTKGTAKNTPGKYADNMTKLGGVAEKGMGAVAGIAKEEATKRSWWQFWKKAPDIGGKGTVLYQRLAGTGIGRKVAPQIGKCAVFLEKHQGMIQGSFAAAGVAIDLIQEIYGEGKERKRQTAIGKIIQAFDENIHGAVHAIMEDLQESVDSVCQEARNNLHSRLGQNSSEDRMRWAAFDLQNRINRLQAEVQNGGDV